jgi:hypothetical protein
MGAMLAISGHFANRPGEYFIARAQIGTLSSPLSFMPPI